MTGQRAWKFGADFHLAEELGLEGQVVFTGYVPPEEMPALYNAADAVRLPVAVRGLRLAGPGGDGLRRAGRHVQRVVDPGSCRRRGAPGRPARRHRALRRHGARPQGRRRFARTLRRRGLERAATFSWEKAARETLEVYGEAVGEG